MDPAGTVQTKKKFLNVASLQEEIRSEMRRCLRSIVERSGCERVSPIDLNSEFLSEDLGLDSIDLAEVVATLETRFGVSVFSSNTSPKTWEELVGVIEAERGAGPGQGQASA